MLKKIMKAALAASLVFGMSSFAYAADGKIGGSFKEYFVQYNSGVEDTTAYFKAIGEANLQFKGTAGKVSVYHEREANQSTDYNNTQTKLTYASGFGAISLGNVTNIATIPMNSAGGKTSNLENNTRRGLVWAGYSESEGADLMIPVAGLGGYVQATLYPDGYNAAASTAATVAGLLGSTVPGTLSTAGAYTPTTYNGMGIQLGADMNFGGIGVRFGYTTSSTADPTDTSDDALTSANMLLGVKVPVGDKIAITFDYVSSKVAYEAWTDDLKATTMDFGVQLKDAGPGTLTVAYDSADVKGGSDGIYKQAIMTLNYDISVGEGSGFQALYYTTTTTYETATIAALMGASDDSLTTSTIGVGLYAAF